MISFNAGSEIRRLRLAAGLSLSQLAQRVNYDKGYLSKIENGNKRLSGDVARLIDAELGTNGYISSFVPNLDVVTSPAEFDIDTVPIGDRRDHLGSATSDTLRASAASPVVIDRLWTLFAQHRDLGRNVSPRLVLGALIAETRAINLLARAAPPPDHYRLFHVASRFAEFIGWMFQECDDIASATRWTTYAGRLADASGVLDVIQFCLIRSADIALSEYRLTEAINLAKYVQDNSNASNHVHAMAAMVEARGHALAGEASTCESALIRADKLAATPVNHTDPVPLGFAGFENLVAAARGWSWRQLGRVSEAADLLEVALHGTSPTSVRSRTRLAVRAAIARAEAGDLLAAVNLIKGSILDVRAVDSASIRSDLRQLLKIINRSRAPDLIELRELLRSAVSSGGPS